MNTELIEENLNNIVPKELVDVVVELERNGATAYLTGGAVRDVVIYGEGATVEDFDLEVFRITPEKLFEVLKRFDPNCKEVGKSFGVYKVQLGLHDVEFSVPRREVKTGPKHTDFEVELPFDITIQEAAQRRDFTINALYYDILYIALIDPTKRGLSDISQHILHPVSEAFKEDALRVLRGMQFAARFNMTTSDTFKQYATDPTLLEELKLVSKERVWGEFYKMATKGRHLDKALTAVPSVTYNSISGWLKLAFDSAMADRQLLYTGEILMQNLHLEPEDRIAVVFALLSRRMYYPRNGSSNKVEPFSVQNLLEDINMPKKFQKQVFALLKHHLDIFVNNFHKTSYQRMLKITVYPATMQQLYCYLSGLVSNLSYMLMLPKPTGKCEFCTGELLLSLGIEPGEDMGSLIDIVNTAYLKGYLNEVDEIEPFLNEIPLYRKLKKIT